MKATPQQKQVYDTILLQALRFLFSEQNAQQFAEQAKADPVEAMVSLTTVLLKQIKTAAASAGRNYVGDPAFIRAAAKELMRHEVEMLVAFGIVSKEQAGQVYDQALKQFLEIVGGGGQPAPQEAPQPQQPPQGGLIQQEV